MNADAPGETDPPEDELVDETSDNTGEHALEEQSGEEQSDQKPQVADDDARDDDSRRSFLTRVAAFVVGAVVSLVPLLVGLVFFCDPLLRKRRGVAAQDRNPRKDDEGFIRLDITRDSLSDDGTPQLITVIDDRVDAWNFFPDVPIGNVWLRRDSLGSVTAFQSICPHLGCSVEYRPSGPDFYCPCHLSAFELSGRKTNQIPPRDMDSLAVKPETGEEIWVQFKNFRGALEEKVEI